MFHHSSSNPNKQVSLHLQNIAHSLVPSYKNQCKVYRYKEVFSQKFLQNYSLIIVSEANPYCLSLLKTFIVDENSHLVSRSFVTFFLLKTSVNSAAFLVELHYFFTNRSVSPALSM